MLMIGIAGGSGSGKTTVVREITQQLKENVVVIPQDSYYKDLGHLSEEEKRVHNFDHPDSIDFDLLRAQLKDLRDGKTVEQPIYSYITCGRSEETLTIRPADVIIVEGILIFCDPKLRKLMDIKIFVDAEPDERLLRVITRDIAERGHPLEMLIGKYRNVLKPMHDEFIEPTKQYADIIIPNGGHNVKAIEMLRLFIQQCLDKR
jgi:uridine kinase